MVLLIVDICQVWRMVLLLIVDIRQVWGRMLLSSLPGVQVWQGQPPEGPPGSFRRGAQEAGRGRHPQRCPPLWGSSTGRSQTHTGETWSLSSLRQQYRQIPNTHRWDMIPILFEAAVQADPKHTQVRHDPCPLWGSSTGRSQTHTGETWSLSSLRQQYRQIPNTHRWDMIPVLFEAAVQADPKHTQVRHDPYPLWGSCTGRSQTHTGETWSLSSLRQQYRQIPNTHRWDMIPILFEAAVQADPKHTQVRHDPYPLWGSSTGRSQTHTGETWSLSSLRQQYRQIPNTHRWDRIPILFEAAVQADPKHTQVRHDPYPLWGSSTGRSQTHTGETWSLSSLRQQYRQIPNTHRWDRIPILFEAAVQADPKHTQVRHDPYPLWGSSTGRSQTHTGETGSLSSLTLYCADRPKPPNPSYAQTVQNRPVKSQFVGLSFTAIRSLFYFNQPAETADLSSM